MNNSNNKTNKSIALTRKHTSSKGIDLKTLKLYTQIEITPTNTSEYRVKCFFLS